MGASGQFQLGWCEMNDSMLFPDASGKPDTSITIPRLEILGIFGSGKSTLAEKLSRSGQVHAVCEQHQANPYWGATRILDRFGYLGYELSFLLHHALLLQSSFELSGTLDLLSCDWSYLSDKVWAGSRLKTKELQAYLQVHEAVTGQCGNPTAYLYLDEPPAVVLQRIKARGRPEELDVTLPMLQRASDLLAQEVERVVDIPVIRVSSGLEPSDMLAAVSERTGTQFRHTPQKT